MRVRLHNPDPGFLGILGNSGGRKKMKRKKRRKSSRRKKTRKKTARRRPTRRKSTRKKTTRKKSTRRRRVSRAPARKRKATSMRKKRKSSRRRRRARRNPARALRLPAQFRKVLQPADWAPQAIAVATGFVVPNLTLMFLPPNWKDTRFKLYASKFASVAAVSWAASMVATRDNANKVFIGGLASVVVDLWTDFVAPLVMGGFPAAGGTQAWYGPDIGGRMGAYYGPDIGYDHEQGGEVDEVTHLEDLIEA